MLPAMNGHKRWSDTPDRHPQPYRTRSHAEGHVAGWLPSLSVLLLLMLSVGFARAEDSVYTWKDASGRVHYSNRPPEGQPVEAVQLNAKPVAVQPTERIYTWTDAEGKVHYGAQPPPDIPAKELKEDDSSLSTIRSGRLRAGEQQLLRELQPRE